MEYRKLGELNPPFVLSPRTLFDYRQAILLFKPAFYPTRSPPPVHQTPPLPPPLSRIFKVGAVHTVITIKPRSRPPSLPYIYPPSRYLRFIRDDKTSVCHCYRDCRRERKGKEKKIAGKEQKGSAEAFSERGAYPNARSTTRLCARSTFLSSLFADPSVLVARSVGEKKRSVRRARRTRGGRGSRKRDTDRSVRERNPRLPWLPSHSRLASLPWRRLSLSLSVSLSFTSFACPLSVSLVHPESSRPFPSTVASRAPLHPPRLPSLRVSPRRRANSAELLSTSPAHSLIFSLRAPWDEEEERAGEIKRNARAR